MIFAALILAAATASPVYDQWGFPRLTPGTWIVTTNVTDPRPSAQAWKYCIQPNYDGNLMQQIMQQNGANGGYDCSISSSAPGVGKATCTKTATNATGTTVKLRLNWKVVSDPGVNFQASVSGVVDMKSQDPSQPSMTAPVAETVSGAYQHVPCSFSTPQPVRVSPQ